MLTLIVQEKGGSPTRMEFDRDEVTVGRVPGNDIVLAKGNVSKRHSRVVRQDGRFFVVDLKSTNGTYLNGRRITTPSVIRPGDKIYIGDFVVMVDMGGEAAVEEAPDALEDAQTGASMPSPFAAQAAFAAPSAAEPMIDEPLIAEEDPPEASPPPGPQGFGAPAMAGGPPPMAARDNGPMGGGPRPPSLQGQSPASPLSPQRTAPLGGPTRPTIGSGPGAAPFQGPPGAPPGAPPSFAGGGGPPASPSSPALRSTAAGLGPARSPLGAPLGPPPGLRPGIGRDGNAPPPLRTVGAEPSAGGPPPLAAPSAPPPLAPPPLAAPPAPPPLAPPPLAPPPLSAPPPLAPPPLAPPTLAAPPPLAGPPSPPVGVPQSMQVTMPPVQAQAVLASPTPVPFAPPSSQFDPFVPDSGREVIPVMPEPLSASMDPMRAPTPVPVAPLTQRPPEPPPPLAAPPSAPAPVVAPPPLSTSLPQSMSSTLMAPVAPVPVPAAPPLAAPPSFAAPQVRLQPRPAPEPPTSGDEYRELLAQVVSAAVAQGVEASERVVEASERARWRASVETAAHAVAALPSGVTHERLGSDALAELVGLGALESALDDPEVTSVVVEPGGRVMVGRGGPLSPSGTWFSSSDALGAVVHRWLHSEGVAHDDGPVIDASSRGGTRMVAVFPPMSSAGVTVALDRPPVRPATLGDLVARGTLSAQAATLLSLAVTSRRNVVVTGPASSGRSTLLGALLGAVAPQERVVVVEPRSELARGRRGAVGLSSAVDGQRAVAVAQRLRPNRLVLSDVSEPVARGALASIATGHEGWLLSIEAPSAMVGLSRLATIGALGPWFSPEDGTERIATTRPLVVEVARLGDGQCRVTSVGEARALDGALFIDLLFSLRVDRSDGAEGISAQLVPTGATASFSG